jgi:hypothetical protein
MFICRWGWYFVPFSQISPLRTQARGTMNQGRSSIDMKRGISDVIQTECAFPCPTASSRRGSKTCIPGCSGPLASARLGPGGSARKENNYIRNYRGYLSHHAQTEPHILTLLDRRMRGTRSRPRERFMMIQDP